MRVKRFVNEEGWAARFEHQYPAENSYSYPYWYAYPSLDTLWHPGDTMTQVTLEPMPYAAGDSLSRRWGYHGIGGAGYGNDGSDRYFSSQYDITRHHGDFSYSDRCINSHEHNGRCGNGWVPVAGK